MTQCSRQLYSHRRRRKDRTAGESRPPLPSTAHISSVARSRTRFVIHHRATHAASCLTLQDKTGAGGMPGSCTQPAPASLPCSHHCWVFPSEEASYTTGHSLRKPSSWRLRKQLVSNRNLLSLMGSTKNLHVSTLPRHCRDRGNL